MIPPKRELTPERKAVYYTGLGIGILGAILFFSVFISGALSFGDFSNFEERTRSMAVRAVTGFILIFIGGIIATIGARGAAGSGIILDPQQARKDLEPFNRMAGGMINDAISEVDVVNKVSEKLSQPAAPAAVKVRCRNCKSLNDESAQFCSRCGQTL